MKTPDRINTARIAPIIGFSRVELLDLIKKLTPSLVSLNPGEDKKKFYTDVLAHMELTMGKMKRFDATAYLISYLLALKDLADKPPTNRKLLDELDDHDINIELIDLNRAEREFLSSPEVNCSITHGVQDYCEEELSILAIACEKRVVQDVIDGLISEITAYQLYIKDKVQEGEDPLDKFKWNARRLLLVQLENQLSAPDITLQQKLENFYTLFNEKKDIITKNPDPHSAPFLRKIAYAFASLCTLGIFNIARMAYRAYSNSTYVGFSSTFSGEKFADNIAAKTPLRPR